MNPHHQAFVDGAQNLQQVQQQVLSLTLQNLCASSYGKQYSAYREMTPETFAHELPLVDYENLRPWIDQIENAQSNSLTADRTVAFFKTSGSTAQPKKIPVTASLMRQKVAAFSSYWGMVYSDYPEIAMGSIVSNFIDAGETSRLASGLELCSESSFWSRRGRALHSMQRWPLPNELRLVKDLDARLFAVARLLLQTPVHCMMCLNPSTLLQFCRVLTRHAPALVNGLQRGDWGTADAQLLEQLTVTGKQSLETYLITDADAAGRLISASRNRGPMLLSDIWPMLKLIICWRSVIVQPYFTQLAPYTGSIPIRDYISQSSECMMAIPLTDGDSGGALAYTSHFFEFIAESDVDSNQPATKFAWQLELGARYEVVVTTGGGLYRYRTGDCVQVNDYMGAVPIIEFLYRFGKTSSITGEKLTEQHVLQAASVATETTGYQPEEYLCFPCTGSLPHYALLIESTKPLSALTEDASIALLWRTAFEDALKAANPEYQDKCASGRLGPMLLYGVEKNVLSLARQQKKAALVSAEQVKSEVLSSRLDIHRDFASAMLIKE